MTGAEATIYVWFLGQIYCSVLYANKGRRYNVASGPAVTDRVFVRRFTVFLEQRSNRAKPVKAMEGQGQGYGCQCQVMGVRVMLGVSVSGYWVSESGYGCQCQVIGC